MKKLLSLVLVLLMILGIVACGTTKPAETPAPVATQAPAAEKPAEQPTEAPKEPEAPKATYVALGLNIKNKTGVTIDAAGRIRTRTRPTMRRTSTSSGKPARPRSCWWSSRTAPRPRRTLES